MRKAAEKRRILFDIVNIYYVLDSGYHYFRMDVAAAPDVISHAPAYGIFIDDAAGGGAHYHAGGSPTGSRYIAAPLTGIDQILVGHWDAAAPNFTSVHRHNFTGNPPNAIGVDTTNFALRNGVAQGAPGPLAGSAFESTGSILEWKIAVSDLGSFSGAKIYGATFDAGTFADTFDYTGPYQFPNDTGAVPEPATLALMTALAGVGFCFRRRLGLRA